MNGDLSFETAQNTIDGLETLPMLQKGQVRYVGKDAIMQGQFVQNLFDVAA